MVEITDRESAEAWFKTQPQEICVATAARAALRSAAGMGNEDHETLDQLALPAFRAMIISAVAANRPTAEIKMAALSAAASAASANSAAYSAAASAALSANSALSAAASAANSAAASAASAASATLSANSAAYSALSADGTETEDHGADARALLSAPIWRHVEEPDGLRDGRKKLLAFFDADPAVWRFWRDWYLAMFDGRWTQWDLARDIALIPDAVWKQGAADVAEAIRTLQEQPGPFDETAARVQAETLKQDAQTASLCAEGLARFLKQVIETTKCDFNGLPKPFEPLAPLTAKLVLLSSSVLRDPSPDVDKELAELLQSTASHVASLVERLRDAQAEVARLRVALEEARDDLAEQDRLREAAYQSPKTGWLRDFAIATAGSAAGAVAPIFLPELYGYLSSGLDFLLGPEAKQTLADLGACYTEFVRPETIPDLAPPTPEELDKLAEDDWA